MTSKKAHHATAATGADLGQAASAPPAPARPEPLIADDFTPAEIADHKEKSLQLVVDMDALWPGLTGLVSKERAGNQGKALAVMDAPLRALFTALTPVQGEPKVTSEARASLISIFNKSLGAADGGADPNRFEVEVLQQRLLRIEAQEKLIEKLDAFRKKLADDILNTGTLVIQPGLKAIDLARSLADSNPDFHTLLAPVIEELSAMTKPARAALAESRAQEKAKQEAAKQKAADKPQPGGPGNGQA
jgi:hypothetical protein